MKQFVQKLTMTVAVLLSFLQASAYDFEANGIYFNITDATNHEVEVTEPGSEREYSGNINIPSTVMNEGTTYTVTSIGGFAFRGCSGLTSVTIPNSVTSIGAFAFDGCKGLTSVTIPNSMTAIGFCAFSGCDGLTSVTVPGSVTSIGNQAFGACSGLIEINVDPSNSFYASVDGVLYNKNLTEIVQYPAGKPETTFTIPSSVTAIGDDAFCDCSVLASVTIPNSVTTIGDYAFGWCTGLTSVTIPNSVTTIGDYAFGWCTGLTSVTIPNSVTSIGGCAFFSCTGLTSITIPNSVASIGLRAFGPCESLIEINVDPRNSFYASVDGVLYNKTITEIVRYPASKPGTTFSIPSSVTSIGDWAFDGCWHLIRVNIPNSVTSIGGWAFDGCEGLTSVTIPNSVTSIETAAFQGCTGLTNVTIPNSVTSIEDWAFWNCPLKSVYCHWEEPISFNDDHHFIDYSYNEGTLYVPKGCAGKYKSTSPWSKFEKIVESDNLGVEDIMENQPAGGYIVYDLKGILRLKTEDIDEVKQLPAGLYIVNGKKVLIR